MKKQPSRQNSAAIESKPHPLTASMSSDRGVNRSVTSLASKPGKAVHSVTASPLPDRTHSPQSAISTSKTQSSSLPLPQIAEPHLAIRRTMAPCPVLHPNALEMLEKETASRYGLTHDAISEAAARSIAEMAISMFDLSIGSRRGSRANTIRGSTSSNVPVDRNIQPVIVILAGNHVIGARALAAARHLCCRKVKIIIAEAQYESVEARDPQLRIQIHITQRIVKSGATIKRGKWDRASGYIKRLPAPPTVIIDALLAGASYESLLRSPNAEFAAEVQREAREMIDWANRSRAPVLSIACPSGVSGIDGTAPLVEGEPLAVRPDKILSFGAPMQGLLEAMRGGERWDVSLADVGINITLRSEEAVPFDSQWVAELRYMEDEGLGIQA